MVVRRQEGGPLRSLRPGYETAILDTYGETVTLPAHGQAGPPEGAVQVPPEGLVYATVEKVKKKGRVVEILTRVVFGTLPAFAGQPIHQHVVAGAAAPDGSPS